MKCKICNKEISEQLKKEVLQDKFTNIEKIALMKVIGAEGAEIIKCPYPGCESENVFEPGQVDYNIKDDIRFIGLYFYKMCFSQKVKNSKWIDDFYIDKNIQNVPYSKNLIYIIFMMLEEDVNI